jgi:hypothetical protein
LHVPRGKKRQGMLFLPKEGADANAGTNEGASGLKSSLRRVKCPIGVYGELVGAIVEHQLKYVECIALATKWSDFGLIEASVTKVAAVVQPHIRLLADHNGVTC